MAIKMGQPSKGSLANAGFKQRNQRILACYGKFVPGVTKDFCPFGKETFDKDSRSRRDLRFIIT